MFLPVIIVDCSRATGVLGFTGFRRGGYDGSRCGPQARRGGNEVIEVRPEIRGAFDQSTPVSASASMKNNARIWQVVSRSGRWLQAYPGPQTPGALRGFDPTY